MYNMNKFNIIPNIKYFSILEFVEDYLVHKRNFILGYLNTYTFDIYNKTKLINSSYPYFFIPDGVGMYLYLKCINFQKLSFKNRLVSTNIWDSILSIANKKSLNCMIIGGQISFTDKLRDVFNSKYPNIDLLEVINGYTQYDIDKFPKKIDVLILGLGTPKQEEWILKNYDNFNISILLMVGSALDYWSGAIKRAPQWIQNIGLEWLYRLFQEPKRLWRRYIFGIPVFMFHIVVQKVKLVLKKISPEC